MAQGHVVAANEFRFQHLARRMGSRSPIPIPIPITIPISRRGFFVRKMDGLGFAAAVL